jgi:[acyl-carrier-protein] S-malonyltransferase
MSPKIALVFPGQGSQVVGMGKALYNTYPEARQVMDTVQAHTRADLLTVMFDGPDAQLLQTQYTQPALLAVSLGALAVVQANCPDVLTHTMATAGHSLGEYGALVAAGVLNTATAATLVNARATLMGQAQAGAMAVVLGLPAHLVRQALADVAGTVVVANDNSPEQVVISGEPSAVSAAADPLKAAGAKRVMPLAVSGAFHSPLMQQAAQAFATVIAPHAPAFQSAAFPVITNVDAEPTLTGHAAKLSAQIDHGVQWTNTMARLVTDYQVDTVVELGSGKVLTGLFKKAHPAVLTVNVADPEGFTQLNTLMQGHMAHA